MEEKSMTNQDIRLKAAGSGVRLWQIAQKLGIADCSLSRKLRRELTDPQKQQIYNIIRELEVKLNEPINEFVAVT
jgi:hypothetical protein